MPVELLWSPQAREDLLDIFVAIGFDNPAAAERLYTKLESKVEHLIDLPRMGVRRPDIRASTRILIEGSGHYHAIQGRTSHALEDGRKAYRYDKGHCIRRPFRRAGVQG